MADRSDDQPLARGTVTHRADAVRMDRYPLLTYGPQADPKVRVASSGTSLEEIFAFQEKYGNENDLPDGALERIFNLSPEEADEVIRWQEDPEAPGRSP